MPLSGAGGAYVRSNWQALPVLTSTQLKAVEVLLQLPGRMPSAEVTDKLLAGLPSSVVKVTVIGVLLPLLTASELGLGVATMLLLVVA